jgi:N-acetyltransferase
MRAKVRTSAESSSGGSWYWSNGMFGTLVGVPWTAKTLAGELVRLEPMTAAHEDGLWDASRDPETWRWLSVFQPTTRAEMREYVQSALANQAAGVEMPFTTIRQVDDRVLGSTRYLALRPEHRSLEIGWTWLTPEAWGTGVNVEAKLLMLGDAFERLGCLRVELKTDSRNERSRGAMAALPAQFEGVHRKQMLVRDGRRRDSAWYSIIDDEWPEVRANLLRRLGRRE